VTLSWKASASPNIIGYNVYRSGAALGPYSKRNSFPIRYPSWADYSVTAGATYFYVATALNSSNLESVFSASVSATIPR
jgi:hypothetical protein